MTLTGTRTYAGFGFGAIQSGLFLYEAFRSGAFGRLVVAEVVPEVVSAVRRAEGNYRVNIAYRDHIECVQVGPIEILNPASEADRRQLIEAIAQADEIGTAVPSVDYYVSRKPGSLHRLLASGLAQKAARRGPRAVIYAAENHNHAAEILEQRVVGEVSPAQRETIHSQVRYLNTVIGKMSQVVADPDEIIRRGLATITPDYGRAFLVESFDRILISKARFDEAFERGIRVFEEKDNLLPFEEAKLYGHNATHALAGYIGAMRGVQRVHDLREIPGVVPFLRAAFVHESGEALIRRHHGMDRLFTPQGYSEYADDLIERMLNPFLMDTIERVTRDTERKLAWNDRLIGVMRLALDNGITPRRYALGAAAALAVLDPSILENETIPDALLKPLWSTASPLQREQDIVLGLIQNAAQQLKGWRASGFLDLDSFCR
ncbi:MAG: hypothetical protein JXJ17_04515 [Anaerolineae bacterium]|nr:hypothetical protein [Anaerolineae bacterium]